MLENIAIVGQLGEIRLLERFFPGLQKKLIFWNIFLV
jgi:hypothetical protein